MCLQEFYPQEFGAYSSYAKYEESGAQGCGTRPICNEKKWITEWQKKGIIKIPHQKQVPNMSCVLKKDAYKACLSAAGQPMPPDEPELPSDTGAQDTGDTIVTAAKKKAVAASKPINWTMISLIALLVIILVVATILIIRAKRAGKI